MFNINLINTLVRNPDGVAVIKGVGKCPSINGKVYFYQTMQGVVVAAEVVSLPQSCDECKQQVFAFHIHSGEHCSGNSEDPFADAKSHYNPKNCEHPYHAGDMPPLFGNNGCAIQIFLTDRFTVKEIEGKTVIIHAHADDFRSQPSGDAGIKIACGKIRCV